MPTSIRSRTSRTPSESQADSGFSLLETVIAGTLLAIGLLGVASAIGYAMVASNHGRSITNAKLLAVSILEQMETLRDTGNLTFGQIANVGQVDNSRAQKNFIGFQAGSQQVSTNPGPDGIFGTAYYLSDAGPDQIFGTVDDYFNPAFAVMGVTRQIEITSLSSSFKKVKVTINYSASGRVRQLVAVSYLNDNSNATFIP